MGEWVLPLVQQVGKKACRFILKMKKEKNRRGAI